MHRRAYLAAVGTAASTGLAGCSSALSVLEDDPCTGDDCHIGMNRTEFLPAEYEVSVGDTVIWKTRARPTTPSRPTKRLAIPDDAEYFASRRLRESGGRIRRLGRPRRPTRDARDVRAHLRDPWHVRILLHSTKGRNDGRNRRFGVTVAKGRRLELADYFIPFRSNYSVE